MEMTMIGWLHQLGTLEFWEALLEGFGGLGPIAPVILAMVESFFPPLPLIAIVALNVAAHGGLLGFVYSWAGVMLGGTVMFLLWRRVVKRFFWKFARRSAKLQKAEQWVSRFDTASLFMLSLLPFTPSSFMHFAFGISDFDEKRYLVTMLLGKGVMVAMMALFGQSLVSAMKPFLKYARKSLYTDGNVYRLFYFGLEETARAMLRSADLPERGSLRQTGQA